MVFSSLTSKQVLDFLPLNTWTEVHLLPSDLKNVYIVTTKNKIEKRMKDMQSISLQSSSYDKVTQFKVLEIVAVEIKGKWYRGKLISFNEFRTDNTRIELIDYGSFYDTQLENLVVLPYYFMYEPLALPVRFKDFIPKKTTFSIKPLLSESNLYEGVVLVEVNCNDLKLENGVDEKQLLESKTDINLAANGQQIISAQNMTNGNDNNELSINSSNDLKIISVQNNITNGHDNNESSLYLSSSSSRKTKEKLNNVPFKNRDYCILTYFEDFTCLYVGKAMKCDDNGSYKFADDVTLSKTAKSTDKIIKYRPVVGDMVKVCSPQDNVYYRAKILKNNNGSFDVFYIDYGNIETVPSNVIYELADELKKPGIAVKIGLSDLKNHQVTERIMNFFNSLCVSEKPLVIEFDENSNCLENVKLKDIENGSYINSEYLMKHTSIQSEPVLIDTNTSINHNNTNQLSDLKNNDKVFLKHFEDMDNVYIVKHVHLLNDMFLKFYQDKTIIRKKELNVGDIVKIVLEKCQYRAKIKNVDTNMIYVQNIDFGYFEFVQENSVCELSDELLKIPGFAIKIGIKLPFVKKTRDLDNFIRNSEKIPLYIEFDERNSSRYQEVTLRKKDNSNIFEEFLKSNKNQLICNEISNNSEQNDIIIKSNESLINDFQSIILRSGDLCLVSYFENFKTIYLCKAVKDDNGVDVSHNYSIILKTMNSKDRNAKTNLVIGDIVKVFSPSFKDFFRAKIINIDNKDFYVFYIDYGNTEIVHLADIFELSDELKKQTILPTPVSIEVPPNAKITDEIQEFFSKLIDGGVVICIESKKQNIDGSENVILRELKSGSLVNTELLKLLPGEKIPIKNYENSTLTLVEDVKCTYVAKDHDLENVKILKETEDSSTSDNVQLKIEEHKQSLDVIDNKITFEPLKNGEVVHLRYFHDSSSVFVSRGSNEDLKLYIDVTSRTIENKSKKKKLDIEVGDIVKAMFENGMYRAKILKKVDKNNFYISFIDFGNEETVNADDIFELPEDLKKIPDLCVKIGIKGSPIIDKSQDVVLKYLDELEDQLLYVEYDEGNPNGLKEANLKRTTNNCDVFYEFYNILDNPIDTKEESIQKPQNIIENETVLISSPELEVISNIKLTTGDTVFCTHFEDFNHLYLCKGSKNNTIPDNYSVIINSKNANDIIVKKDPKYKDIVRVKFEEKIFRGEVLDKCGEKYSVFLLDIGKNIDVLGYNIYELPNSLINIPGLALKVGLKGTTGLIITKTLKDYFHNLWQNDPVPLILRYDEGNFNYLNEVSLVKQSSGQDIVDDLVKIFSKTDNMSNKPKLATSYSQGTKSIGSNINNWKSGDHVEFLFGNNVDNIFVRKIKLYEEFKNVLDQLKGDSSENYKPIAAKSNDIVAVYSTKNNGGIYRARVSIPSFDNTNMVKCSLIDIGQVDMIPAKNIFSLPNYVSLSKIPTMVRRVSLTGLNKILNSKIASYLSSLIGKTYVMEYDKKAEQWHKQEVVLKELQSSVSLNDEIQKLFSNESSPREIISQQRRLERKIIMPEIKESPLEKPSHPIKSGSSVFVTNFENFNSIFIRDASYEFIENFNTFNKQMLKYYRNAKNNSPKEMLKIGDKVCVESLLNVVMHSRACITNIIDNEYNVFYLDYGNTEIVNAEDIMDLPKELEKFPNFAIKVQLQNMPPLNTKNEIQVIKNHFKKNFIIPNATLSIEFNEFNPKGLDDVVLRTEYYKKDIVEDINDLLNAPPLNIKTTGKN